MSFVNFSSIHTSPKNDKKLPKRANVYMHSELTVDEMLLDPIVRIIMRCDSVSEADIRRVIGEAEERFATTQ